MTRVRPSAVRASALVLVAGALAAAASTEAGAAVPSVTELVSANPAGLGAAGVSSVGYGADLSNDGRYVAFASGARDLVKQAHGSRIHVYVRDRQAQKTIRLDPTPKAGPADALSPSISGDGRYVSFSADGALVPEDTNDRSDVYVKDLKDDSLHRVSFRTNGTQTADHSFNEDLSADGRYVLFRTSDVSLTGPDTGSALLVVDRTTNGMIRIDLSTAGEFAQEDPNAPLALPSAISPNGRYVAFTSTAANLVAEGARGCERQVYGGTEKAAGNCTDVYLRDRDTDGDGIYDEEGAVATTLVTNSGAAGAGDSRVVGQGSVADDGTVAIASHAPAFGAAANRPNVYVVPAGSDVPELVGEDGLGATVSAEARFVAYSSRAKNGYDGATTEAHRVWVLDRQTGERELAGVAADGSALGRAATGGAIAPGGRMLLFSTLDRSMLAQNSKSYRQENVFVRDRGVPDPVPGVVDALVTGGELLDTDHAGEGATAKTPVQTRIAVPAGIRGTVRAVPLEPGPSGPYEFFARRLSIVGPPATVADPYVVTFTVDSSALAGTLPDDVQLFRDGTLLTGCTDPKAAVANGCVVSRGTAKGGDAYVTVRTPAMGEWNLGRNRAPVVTLAQIAPKVLMPNDEMQKVVVSGITDPDGDPVSVSITRVTQDEPTSEWRGPDAVLGPTGSGWARLRGSRDLTGDGRVYRVTFTATDSSGRSSTGSVPVAVPRPVFEKAAVDSGQQYPSA